MAPRKGFLSLEIPNADALEQALRDLGSDPDILKTLSAALLIAGEPMAKAARQKVPRRTGRLQESIDVSTQLSRRQRRNARRQGALERTVYVGAKPIGPSILLEFGTTKRHWKTGKSTGHVPPHPFMRPAFEETKEQALELLGKALWIQIEKSANRIARRTAKAAK